MPNKDSNQSNTSPNEIVRLARIKGYIKFDRLPSIMADHIEDYKQHIAVLWKKYIKRKSEPPIGGQIEEMLAWLHLSVESENNRAIGQGRLEQLVLVYSWEILFNRFAYRFDCERPIKANNIPYLSLYKETTLGRYEGFALNINPMTRLPEYPTGHSDLFVKLEGEKDPDRYDLKRYFTDTLEIPMPILLFDEEGEEHKPELKSGRNEHTKSQYIFKRTGPTWSITYNDKQLDGLRGTGFQYIYYLIQNPAKPFHTNELAGIDATPVSKELSQRRKLEFGKSQQEGQFKKNATTDNVSKIEEKQVAELKKESNRLAQEKRKAEESGDQHRADKAKKEYEDFRKFAADSLKPNGTLIRTEDVKTKDRITKAIDRAVGSLLEHDKGTCQHFRAALKPINSFNLSYDPDREIIWLTE